MWVSQKDKWNKKTSTFQRLFIEKMIQRCDFNESISNRHRTTNGYVQLKELLNLIRLTEYRGKSVKTLIILGEETKSKKVKQNIINDFIISKYFIDLKDFIVGFDFEILESNQRPNLLKIQELKHKLEIFEIQLDKHYLNSLLKEFKSGDLDENKFQRHAEYLEALIDIYVTYLIFNGYSASTITSFLTKQLSKGRQITLDSFTKVFNFNQRSFKHYLALNDINDDIGDFASLLNNELKVEVHDVGKDEALDKQIGNLPYLKFTAKSLDANSYARSLYDKLLKKLVVKRDRESLNSFNNFFDNAYWAHLNANQVFKTELLGDPINVRARDRTLLKTLKELGIIKTIDKTEIPEIRNLKLFNAVYYYNLALGSKSIENSLALLWTSLESSIPYRTSTSDVDCVRNILSKILSLGSIARDVNSLSKRFNSVQKINVKALKGSGVSSLKIPRSDEDIKTAFNWLKQDKPKRFEMVKDCSDLLAFEYAKFGKMISEGKAKDLLERIQSSQESIQFQVQRIYIHRNQIIHAGDFISEYTNLWMNIEWYTGKLLAFMIKQDLSKQPIEKAVQNLESDFEYVISYLKKNKNVKISDLPERIISIFMNQFWQSF